MSVNRFECLARDIVTVEVSVAKASDDEVIEQAIVAKLQASPRAKVARQQSNHHVAPCTQRFEQVLDARQNTTSVFSQALGQHAQVGALEACPVLRRVVGDGDLPGG